MLATLGAAEISTKKFSRNGSSTERGELTTGRSLLGEEFGIFYIPLIALLSSMAVLVHQIPEDMFVIHFPKEEILICLAQQ
jgi:hypothetical protein